MLASAEDGAEFAHLVLKPARMLPAPTRFGHTTLPSGTRLAWRVDGTGPTLLIYNGLVSSSVHWRFWIEHFRRRYAVLTWDYPGHGASPRPTHLDEVGIAAFADEGHRVLADAQARAGVERPATLCGLSMGVQAVLEHARLHPDDAQALVLLCGTPGHPLDRLTRSAVVRQAVVAALSRLADAAGPHSRIASTVAQLLAPVLRSPLPRELAYLTGGARRDACPHSVLDELFAGVAAMDGDVVLRAVASYLEHDARDVLPRLAVPALIFAGDRDQLTPVSVAEEMRDAIPDAWLHVVHGHSHLAQVECPDAIHAEVERFLAERVFGAARASG